MTIQRRCSHQTARENHPGDTPEECYHRSLAIPFLDHLKSDIESRFAAHSLLTIKCLSIIPSCFAAAGAGSDDEVLEFFSSDIEFKSTAKAELELWRSNFKDKEIPDTPQSPLKHTSPVMFPNIRKMLIHMMVLPVTSCEAERSFSTLRRLKTYLRTTMNQECLNGLALLNIYNFTTYIPPTMQN